MAVFQDLTGQTFGNLTVLGQAPSYISPKGKKTTCWLVRCELCGTEKVMLRNVLIRAASCGCQRSGKIKELGITMRNIKKCSVCGREFYAPPSSKKKTCSKECELKNKSAVHKGKSFGWSDEAKKRFAQNPSHLKQARTQVIEATKTAMALPEGCKGAQHRDSKVWIVKSPENTVLKIVGLAQWARNNYKLFEPDSTDPAATANRIHAGFSAMSSSLSGYRQKKGCMVGQYKGWQLIYVGEKDEEEQAQALKKFYDHACPETGC